MGHIFSNQTQYVLELKPYLNLLPNPKRFVFDHSKMLIIQNWSLNVRVLLNILYFVCKITKKLLIAFHFSQLVLEISRKHFYRRTNQIFPPKEPISDIGKFPDVRRWLTLVHNHVWMVIYSLGACI